jgi:hypothetical protein
MVYSQGTKPACGVRDVEGSFESEQKGLLKGRLLQIDGRSGRTRGRASPSLVGAAVEAVGGLAVAPPPLIFFAVALALAPARAPGVALAPATLLADAR